MQLTIAIAELATAVRTALAAGERRIDVVLRGGGAARAAALARRWPFLDLRVADIGESELAAAGAMAVPAGTTAILVPGHPRLARRIADLAGVRHASGLPGRHPGACVFDPWNLPGITNLAARRCAAIAPPPPPPAATGPGRDLRTPLLARIARTLEPDFGSDPGPEEVVQPDAGWRGWCCPGLAEAQAWQRRLVAAGVIVRRRGRVLAMPAGHAHAVPGRACPPPSPDPPALPTILRLHEPADATASVLANAIDAMGADTVVVQPLIDDLAEHLDLVERLRLIARRRPFLDLHLAAPPTADERAARLVAHLPVAASLRLHGADRGTLAVLEDALARRGFAVDDPAGEAVDAGDLGDLLDGRTAQALTDRGLMPDPWLEVAQDLAGGEAHHGGGPDETVTVALAGPVAQAVSAPAPPAGPISPQEPVLVEPVAAADAVGSATVLRDLARGLRLLTGLTLVASPVPGWLGLRVPDATFLLRAVVAQGILARRSDEVLWLPVGPGFRQRREIRSILAAVVRALCALPAPTGVSHTMARRGSALT